MFLVTMTLTFDVLTPKLIGIINGSWLTMTLYMVFLSLIGFKLLSGQEFYAPGHCDLDFLPTDLNIDRDHLWVMSN